MYNDALMVKVNEALLTVLIASSPILLAAMLIGVLVGLIQALTQIQDQTLPQAVKLIAALLIIMMLGPLFARGIVEQASTALDEFPVLTR